MSDTDRPEFTLNATDIARALGLSSDELKQAMAQGIVYQTTEKGEGDHAGTWRVTFRYRARTARFVLDGAGNVRAVS